MNKRKLTLLFSLLILLTLMLAVPTCADWAQNKKGTKIWYTDSTGQKVTGLQKIGSYTYCFDETGLLQTGWIRTEEGLRYFDKEGKAGKKLGSMLHSGIRTVGKYRYGFDGNGVVLKGLNKIGNAWYCFNTSGQTGKAGRMLTDKFVNLADGTRAYFRENGKRAFKRWVRDKKYYIDATGNLLRSSVAPGGYLVNAKGKVVKKLSTEFFKMGGKTYFYKKNKILKNKVFRYDGYYYYVDQDGIRRKGWINWKGHRYYFGKKGRAATGKVKIGGVFYTFTSKGRLDEDGGSYSTGTKAKTGKASILILCGHGQGDPGAAGYNSCGTFKESQLTREFGKLVYHDLKASGKVNAYLFDTKYDMFQQMRSRLNADMSTSSITGTGSKRKKVLKSIRKSSVIPDPTMYDFVLEIHFNATMPASKDPSGNGSIKGTGICVNVHKSSSDRAIDEKIIKYLNSCGMRTSSLGINRGSGLLNAKVYQEVGVNYTLLETCHIDDNDDMKFYKKHKEQMSKQVAQAVIDYFK